MKQFLGDDVTALLAPSRSIEGRKHLANWIARRENFSAMFAEVASYVGKFDDPDASKSAASRYAKLRANLISDPLIREFEAARKGATAEAFAAARCDILEDAGYRARFEHTLSSLVRTGYSGTDDSPVNSETSHVPYYVCKPNFHWLQYVSEDTFLRTHLGGIWNIGTNLMSASDPGYNKYVLSSGMLGVLRSYLQDEFPSFRPRRILDIGCSGGSSTMTLAMLFPEAEVWGIDVSEALLNCARVHAAWLDVPIKFACKNAESTDFEPGSFDLVTSVIVFHELPNGVRRNVIEECGRLLSKGGIMAHLEGATYMEPESLFGAYWRESAVRTNNEWYVGAASRNLLESYIRKSTLSYEPKLLRKIGQPSDLFGNKAGSYMLIGARQD